METEASCGQNNFEMSETLATFLASTPLLEDAWRLCSIANTSSPGAYLVQQIGTVAYIAFSGIQMSAGSDQNCRNLVALDAEDGGLFAPLYRHSEAEEPIKVHHGMLKLFFSMIPSLQIQIAALMGKVKSIVITGQCIGGTTASLSSLWLLCNLLSMSPPPMSVLCITFGSPLLGNEAFHRSILRQRWGGNFCHVVSKHDIMPRLLFADLVSHIPRIQSLLQFWHCCMASPHHFVQGLSSQLPSDVKDTLFHCVLKDLELIAQADDPSESLFWPFGSYVFCCQEGAICVENVASVIKMMHLMLATGSPSHSIEDHLRYGEYVAKVSTQLLLKARNFNEEGMIPDSSYEAGVALALQSSDLTSEAPVAVKAKECLQMAHHSDKPNLTAAYLAIKLSKIVPFRAEIEWYKACCDEADDQMGYYDSFKLRGASRREARVNMNRHRLAQFWDSVIHMLDNNKLPHDFDRREKWVNASQSYKLLVEPLDIADYYRNGKHIEHGHYIEHGRQRRYEIFDKWWRERSVPEEENKRSKFASLTQDSCFWGKVEEAREWLDNVRSESDVRKRHQLWLKIDMFEGYARNLIENKEVSKDVLAKNSSFSRWMGEWKEMKSQVQQIPQLFPGFVDGEVVP
ncbi:ARABIDOPSIS PHYTOALEXIN DEFICIENT 4, PHYTOALEXIN DEFICIENT 4 [Hibiscus trionum]|uniref:ARABIDOPSIS PHYTOALEXIN DEFICIENT 4, PHYTOALEXIN DEFICIENT 4 n=1 Tax=Hibiscus trionum TaxID=183268 RepID=A0A9W7GZY5_HIBTR|nr:ARABIDOPSIS PHYTOALEXIN DEFICIENT 4, PHYTOALEXIN DEFICIENT 4 [Hibiscus trionum]